MDKKEETFEVVDDTMNEFVEKIESICRVYDCNKYKVMLYVLHSISEKYYEELEEESEKIDRHFDQLA